MCACENAGDRGGERGIDRRERSYLKDKETSGNYLNDSRGIEMGRDAAFTAVSYLRRPLLTPRNFSRHIE